MSTQGLNALVNNIKMANILSPLLEAVEINKRTEGVQGLNASDMLRDVIATGTEIYQKVASKDGATASLLGDQIFMLLALCLRNSTVLYNSPSLDVIKDDLVQLINENKAVLHQAINSDEDESTLPPSTSLGISALTTLFIPVWLFHSNIFTSGLVNLEKLNDLNSKVCLFLSQAIEKIHNLSEKDLPQDIKAHLHYLCAEVSSKIMVDYQLKLLKSKSVMLEYIDDPIPIMERLLPVLHSTWGTLNELTLMSMKSLTGKA